MIWKILILVAFVVLVALYLNERSWTKFFRDNGHWWQNHSDKWAKQAEDCLDLAKRRFYRGLVERKEDGAILEVFGVYTDPDSAIDPELFLVFDAGKWTWIESTECVPLEYAEIPGKPTEGPSAAPYYANVTADEARGMEP